MASFEDCSSKGIELLYKGVAERSSASWHSEECPTRLGWSPFRVTGSSEAKLRIRESKACTLPLQERSRYIQGRLPAKESEFYTGKGVI